MRLKRAFFLMFKRWPFWQRFGMWDFLYGRVTFLEAFSTEAEFSDTFPLEARFYEAFSTEVEFLEVP